MAIPLPQEFQASLKELQGQLAGAGADVKWVATHQIHVTLRFLGEIAEDQRGAVEGLLAEVGGRTAPFELELGALGAFPTSSAPRVIWVAVRSGKPQVERLAQAIEAGVRRVGFPPETRPFSAHITIGRVRSSRNRPLLVRRLRDAAWQPPPGIRVGSVRLYQSVLSAAGPTHTVLTEVPLSGPAQIG